MEKLQDEADDARDQAAVLLDPAGRPARSPRTALCPRCGAGPDQRVASSGFGDPHPVCRRCGHEWTGERFDG